MQKKNEINVISSHFIQKNPSILCKIEQFDEEIQILYKFYKKAGQKHVWTFYETLSTEEQITFLKQLKSFDPLNINQILYDAFILNQNISKHHEILPLPLERCASTLTASDEDLSRWKSIGLEHIFHNQVAVIVLAGGQGTRLGTNDPKGCFDIGLPSHKSLFQLQAERIQCLQVLAQFKYSSTTPVNIPWYIMTSHSTRSFTEKFFHQHNFFGLSQENVIFFNQANLPCLSYDGKILLESKGKIAVSPNGNGGIYQALLDSNILNDMLARKIQHIHCFCVDNCLVRVADPVFIGFSIEKDLDVSTKVVRKLNASEKVGLVVLKDGKPSVIEYSEITNDISEAIDESTNDLKFSAANIVNHYFNIRFLLQISTWESKLPYHIAKKKVSFYDIQSEKTIVPEIPNAIKLEKFIFDVFPQVSLNKFGCLEVARTDEFSALKNSQGSKEDNADTSRRDILAQGKRWVEQAHGIIVGNPFDGIEISPLVSYAGENLEFMQDKHYEVLSIIEK
ncbi:hypothetical protein PCK1_001701 [Pneumocystis canis]|nr:hypothetical protein PCK1_001701 [Pneumocystis canis]